MTGNDTSLLVVTGSVSSQLQDLSGQILQDSRQVDRFAGTDSLGIVTLTQQPVDTTHVKRNGKAFALAFPQATKAGKKERKCVGGETCET